MRQTLPVVLMVSWIALAGRGDDKPSTDPTPNDTFSPTSDVTLSGEQIFENVRIPAGVTVTADGDLRLRGRRSLEVAGSIVSDGHAIEIECDSSLTITGTMRNSSSGVEREGAGNASSMGPGLTVGGWRPRTA